MIRLALGAAPPALAAARRDGIERAARLLPSATKRSDAIKGYRPPTQQTLHDRQYGKCAWCERYVGKTTQPVEHIRPKLGARGVDTAGRPTLDNDHYWWLAWSWSNLVWACGTCNDQAHKANHFPVKPGTPRIAPPTFPVQLPLSAAFFDTSSEQRMLVHPREDDPLDHIQWVVVDRRQPRPRWRWKVLPRDAMGETTVNILHLDELEDQVNAHLRSAVLGRDRELLQHLTADRTEEATNAWDELLTTVLDDPEQLFRAASWWAVQDLWPSSATVTFGWRRPARPTVSW